MAPRSSALAPVPAFLGGSCPLGCSLSAPATGGFSVVSTVLMYAAGSEEEKGVGGLLHGDTIAQLFVFCKGGLAVGLRGGGGAARGRMVLSWRAPSISGGVGLACAAIPPAPPSNVFGNRGTPPVPPAGAAAPAPRLGDGGGGAGGACWPSAGYGEGEEREEGRGGVLAYRRPSPVVLSLRPSAQRHAPARGHTRTTPSVPPRDPDRPRRAAFVLNRRRN